VDLVQRRFRAERANQLWCTDITQIRTGEGWLYAAVIIDVHSRRIISWAISNHVRLETALEALAAAIAARRPGPGLVVHSDRGYQFTSWEWLGRLRREGFQPSMGNVGSALDNALIESWFSSFKNEALHPFAQPATRQKARQILFRHIHFHNTRRLHSALGYLSPADFEATTNNLSV
jgi:putative transposase